MHIIPVMHLGVVNLETITYTKTYVSFGTVHNSGYFYWPFGVMLPLAS
jgi:hypothetical protein